MMEKYEPYEVYKNISSYLKIRNLKTNEKFDVSSDDFINTFEHIGFYKIDAISERAKSTGRAVLILIVYSESNYIARGASFRDLIATKKWDEAIIIVPRMFFAKKNMLDQARDLYMNAKDHRGFLGVYPYGIFSLVVPDHEGVPKHTVMSSEEANAFLAQDKVRREDLPCISVSDPAVVWIGGRPGQLIKIIRDSEIAGPAMSVRYVVDAVDMGADIYRGQL